MASQVKIEELDKPPRGEDDAKETKTPRRKPSPTARAKSDEQLKGRLSGMLDRIVESLETRGDGELAEAIREDAGVISASLVRLTRPFKPLRTIVLAVVAVIEPVLAFGRIARILAVRYADRRQTQAEQERARANGSE